MTLYKLAYILIVEEITMKKIILVSLLALLSGCGVAKELACNGFKSDLLCVMVDGNTENRVDNLENQQLEQNKRLFDLENRIMVTEDTLGYLLTKDKYTTVTVGNMQAQIDATYMQLGQLAAEVAGLPKTSVSIIDPCPNVNSSSAKEMLLVIGDKTVAYFEDGGNRRFLAVIKPGVLYRTTDSRACNFSL